MSRLHRPEPASAQAPEGRLRALIATWRERAKDAAKYGVRHALKSHREYFGSLNAAFAVDECANELDALLATPDPASEAPHPQKGAFEALSDALDFAKAQESEAHVEALIARVRELEQEQEMFKEAVLPLLRVFESEASSRIPDPSEVITKVRKLEQERSVEPR